MYFDESFLKQIYHKPQGKYTVNKDTALQMAQHIYSAMMRDAEGIYSNREKYRIAELYARGEQDVTKYMDILDPLEPIKAETTRNGKKQIVSTGNFARKGYGNIRWETYSFMQKLVESVVGRMMKVETDITCQSIDPRTKEEKKKRKKKAWLNRDIGSDIAKLTGENINYIPSSKEELDFVYSNDKIDYEIGIENAIKDDMRQSDWDDCREDIIRDAINTNKVCGETYIKDNQVRFDRLHPSTAFFQYSRYRDYKNSDFCGKLVEYSMAELKRDFDLTDKELYDIAKMVNGRGGNTELAYLDSVSNFDAEKLDHSKSWDECNWGDFTVPVLKAYWKKFDDYIEEEIEGYIINKDKVRESEIKSGKLRKTADGSYVKPKEGGEKHKVVKDEHKREMVYQAEWVVGTEIVKNYKVMPYQIRVGKNSMLPIVMVRGKGKSINEKAQGIIDDLHIQIYKLQNAAANSPNSGVVWDYHSLLATTSTLKGISAPTELIKMRREGSGDMVMVFGDTSDTIKGSFGGTGYRIPFKEVEGGIGRQLTEFFMIYEQKTRELQTLTGISPEMMAQKTSGDDTAYQAQIRANSTLDVLYPTYVMISKITGMLAKHAAYRIQKLVSWNKDAEESYKKIMDEKYIDAIIKVEKSNNSWFDWGIDIRDLPTEEEKMEVQKMLEISMSAGRDGRAGIEDSDYFLVMDVFNGGGSVKMARQVLLNRENMRREKQKKDQEDAMRIQGEEARKTQQEKMAAEAEKAKKEHENKIAEIEAEGEQERLTEQVKHNNKMLEIAESERMGGVSE